MQQQAFVTAQSECTMAPESAVTALIPNSCSYTATHLCLARATCCACTLKPCDPPTPSVCHRRIIVAMALRQSQSLLPRLGALRGLFTQSQAAQGELGALAKGMADRLQCMLCWVRICGSRPVLHRGIVAPISPGSAP